MFRDYRAVRTDVRAGEGCANDFAAVFPMLDVVTSREDVRGAGAWITSKAIEVTLFEAFVEAVNGFKSFRCGE